MGDQPRARKPRAATNGTQAHDMPIEAALAELEHIAQRLEDPTVPLEESLSLYERGKALAAHCQQVLREATLRVEVLRTVEDHTTTLDKFALDEDE